MAELNTSEQAGGRFKRRPAPPRVDLTAMVDLAFLLITFFMLTTTLAKKRAQPVAMPDQSTNIDLPVPQSRTMTVCLGAGNKAVYFMGMAESPLTKPVVVSYTKDGLRKVLTEKSREIAVKTGKDLIVLLKPSDHSVYGNLINAIDELNITKINRYAIEDIGPKEIDLLKQQHSY
jgi:biopolymer transport protein ExbD